MPTRDRHDDLAQVPLFRDIPRRRRRALSRQAIRLEVPTGSALFEENSEGHEFVAVLGGQVEVRRDGATVAVLGPGDYLGEAALMTHEHRNASAVARTDAEILCIGQSDFAELVARWPSIAEEIRTTSEQRRATS
jgi:CRP/FNR family transcriptional regulator, cyclic AMP receptor protein